MSLALPRESKNQTLPIGSGESFICIILKAILCLVLDFQGLHFYSTLPAFIAFVFSYALYMHHIISWGYFWLPQYIKIFEVESQGVSFLWDKCAQ